MEGEGRRPHGRDEIVTAVVTAATELFAARGPAAVSLREVAAAADVTLSQIHRHIGNKEALLQAVLQHDLQRAIGGAAGLAPADLQRWLRLLFQPPSPVDVRTKLHGRIILDGFDLPSLQERFPGMERTIDLLRSSVPDDQARVRTALLTSFFAGWRLFGHVYLRAAGIEDEVDPVRFAEIVGPVLDAIAGAPPGPDPHTGTS